MCTQTPTQLPGGRLKVAVSVWRVRGKSPTRMVRRAESERHLPAFQYFSLNSDPKLVKFGLLSVRCCLWVARCREDPRQGRVSGGRGRAHILTWDPRRMLFDALLGVFMHTSGPFSNVAPVNQLGALFGLRCEEKEPSECKRLQGKLGALYDNPVI